MNSSLDKDYFYAKLYHIVDSSLYVNVDDYEEVMTTTVVKLNSLLTYLADLNKVETVNLMNRSDIDDADIWNEKYAKYLIEFDELATTAGQHIA